VILKSDINLSTQNALIVRFRSQTASMGFIKRLNVYLHKRYIKQRDCRTPA
jgi:hypothetical protein